MYTKTIHKLCKIEALGMIYEHISPIEHPTQTHMATTYIAMTWCDSKSFDLEGKSGIWMTKFHKEPFLFDVQRIYFGIHEWNV